MGGIHPEESAAVGTQLFHRNKRSQRTDYDGLLLCLTIAPRTHRARLERRNLMCRFESHRSSLLEKHQGQKKRHRQKGVDDHPPHIDEEIAYFRFTSERSNDCGQATEPDRRRKKEIRDTKENLTEIRKMLIARVMLEICVSHERNHAVEDSGGR